MKKQILTFIIVFMAIGIIARDIKTTNGKVYKNIKINQIKPHGLEIMHSSGIAFVEFEDLPKEIQKEYQYDQKKAIKYKKDLEDQRKKRAKYLAKQREIERKKKEAETEKRKQSAKAKKDRLLAIKQKILQKGVLAYIVSNKLYTINGSKMIYKFSKVGSLCPSDGKYMLYKKNLYKVKKNVVPVTSILKNIGASIKNISEAIPKINKKIKKWESEKTKINKNIATLLSKTSININITSISNYNLDGDILYINNKRVETTATEYATLQELSFLYRDYNGVILAITNANTRIGNLKQELNNHKKDFSYLSSKIKTFKNKQNQYIKKLNPEIEQANQEKHKIKEQLQKLKKMYEEGLISKEIYDKKTAELMNKYIE